MSKPRKVVKLKILSSPTKAPYTSDTDSPRSMRSVINIPSPSEDNTIVFDKSAGRTSLDTSWRDTSWREIYDDTVHSGGGEAEQTVEGVQTAGEGLKKSSHGRVSYNRQHSLSEDELPGKAKMVRGGYFKVLHRVCNEAARERVYQSDLKSIKVTAALVETVVENTHLSITPPHDVVENSHLVISDTLNDSLTQLEDKENLIDAMAVLDLERQTKEQALSHLTTKREQHYEQYRRSAEQSIECYEKFCTSARQRWEGQVAEINKRNSQKSLSIESDYVKLQSMYQTQYEESKSIIKKVEDLEKRKVLEEIRRREKVQSSMSNILKQEKTITDAVTGVKQSVESRLKAPEVAQLINALYTSLAEVYSVKSEAVRMYNVGELGPQTAAKFEEDINAQYNVVLRLIQQMNRVVTALEAAERKVPTPPPVQPEQIPPPPPQQSVPVAQHAPQPAAPQPAAPQPAAPQVSKEQKEACIKATIVSPSAYQQYERLCKQLKSVQDGLEKFVKTADVAKMRSALKLVTVTPINSISASSSQHMASKVSELSDVLSGKTLVRNGKTISPGFNDITLSYCFNVAASKFVDQGCEQVAFSDNLIPAFSIGAVITGIWQNHPRFGELYLAHLHQRCPYTIPAHWPKRGDEDNTAYLKRLGYSVDGEGVEEKEKFLEKMSGAVTLYAAIIQSPPPHVTKPHPHGLDHGWVWLARLINLQPIPDVTATVLEAFLKVAAYSLHQKYKGQFIKLLDSLYRQYLPKLEEVMDPKNMGPITRLKLFLEKIKTSGTISKPAGRIEENICR